jgi:nitrogen fixation/metabolism regulation signal transduction histidine kinase
MPSWPSCARAASLLAMALTDLFNKPIQHLIDSARRVSAGELASIPVSNSQDEFGELSRSFNAVVQSLQTQTALVDHKNQENERLLLSVFPAAIARRLQRGSASTPVTSSPASSASRSWSTTSGAKR